MNFLGDGDRADLARSGLSDDTIAQAGLRSAPEPEVHELLGYPAGRGLVFPYPAINGALPYARVKLHRAGRDGKRYRSPVRRGNRLYFTPGVDWDRVLTDPEQPIVITEGEKKALKGTQEGLTVLGLSGVWSWREKAAGSQSRPIADLDHVVWAGRLVLVAFDSDITANADVERGEQALGAELGRRGADVNGVRIPAGQDGAKRGLDDYLCSHTREQFLFLPRVPLAAPLNNGSEPMLVRLSDVETEPVDWLWRDRLARGKLTLLIGDPGLGKSYVALACAATLSRGAKWIDGSQASTTDTVVLSGEDGMADTIRPRLDLLEGDPSRVHVLQGVRDRQGRQRAVSLSHDLHAIERACLDTGAGLAIIDPITAYLGGSGTNTWRDSDVRAVLSPVVAMAERTRVGVLGVMHLAKDSQRAALYRAGGFHRLRGPSAHRAGRG